MKNSKYNTFLTYEGSKFGHNSYTNEFVMLDPLLYDLYDNGMKKNDFTELNEIHPEFYSFLIHKGFLIDDSIDEFEVVKQHSIEIDNDSSQFHLIINPTMNCNFKCWYCYETHIKDSKMDETTIAALVTLSENIVKGQKGLKKFYLSFFGGEPLLYFDKVIKPILKSVYAICEANHIHFSAGMTTNGLLITEDMLKVCSSYSLDGFQITLDGNKEQHDKVRFISEERGSYEKIVNNIILAAKHKLRVNVRINCSANTMRDIKDILFDFNELSDDERNYIHFDFQKVWQEEERIENSINETGFYFKEMGYSVSGFDEHMGGNVLNSCYGDKRYQATVNYNGEVFKCTARDFTNGSGEGTLTEEGVIIWNEKFEKRLSSKFKNEPCKQCRILPLCGGGCSQHAMEHEGRDYCVMGYDEDAKTQIIVNKLRTILGSATPT